ncbi:beta-ketoacyl synthase [Niabella soli DSM 19437]|uniref:Beta-ketoacyl synthase n=1 Tax=Niabella soli DSM 19437 TaxID=929713 RepID=W0ETL2_9BACT|nr:beta-ketoacyl synthase [Niabella soli DSM 19437]
MAIIGMECNLPGATTVEAFWDLLKNGREAITFFREDEVDPFVPDRIKNDSNYVKARGILKEVEYFDADFFGMNPRLVELMDPQHRLFLETSRNLLEKTGYLADKKDCIIGVYSGCNINTYFNNNVVWHRDKMELQGAIPVESVNDKDYIPARVAYHLNLRGPAVNVNSACATSAVAIAQAVAGLRAGQCEVAIAGAAAVTAPVNSGHLYEEGSMLNIDGHTRPFDSAGTGTVFSDGIGAILLKPLDDAERDGDIIYAVIKGVGVSNDGGNKASFSAPSIEGQAQAIALAIQDAQVVPSQISYIEAHGTATPVGDPIEIEGLKLAFGEQEKKQYCAIGSVKSNIGHANHTAGVAGVIKVALSMQHKQLPPSINFVEANPKIDFENSPFVVNDKLKDWVVDGKRIAGISSFGVGGSNAHIIVEEYNSPAEKKHSEPDQVVTPQIIAWSAKTEKSLRDYSEKLREYIDANPGAALADIAYTLQHTRQELGIRNALVAKNLDDLRDQLTDATKLSSSVNVVKEKGANIVFMFPGQGSQYINMGKELYRTEHVYRAAIDECAGILLNEMKEDIRRIIFPEQEDERATEHLKNTYYTQPAIFITSYALARLYMSWGILPNALMGHSVGEFVAAHLAGVFSLADALKIVSTRARLISGLPGGSMLSVRTSVDAIQSFLPKNISVAAINAPQLCVLSGENNVIEAFSQVLNKKDILNKLLRTSHAFHSEMMEPIVQPLEQVVEAAALNVPRIPILSTVTASWLKDEEALSPAYWADHSRATVRFSGAVKAIEEELQPIFLEVGAGITTTVLTKQHGGEISKRTFASLDTSNKAEGEPAAIKGALAKLWLKGVTINWEPIHNGYKPTLLHSVPTYSFDRKRIWIDPLSDAVSDNNRQVNNVGTALQSDPVRPVQKSVAAAPGRKEVIIKKVAELIELISGIDLASANPHSNFTELGLDSLLLTQVGSALKREFKLPISFRQLNEDYDTLDKVAVYFDSKLPPDAYAENALSSEKKITEVPQQYPTQRVVAAGNLKEDGAVALAAIMQQLNMLTQQVAKLEEGARSKETPVLSDVNANRKSDKNEGAIVMDSTKPPMAGARLGRDRQGNPAWFIEDAGNPGNYIQL